jgi:hypothetical protein
LADPADRTHASVAFEPVDPVFTRIGRLAGTRVTERPSVLYPIPNIFHCQSTGQIGWHASLQIGESRVSCAEVTSYFRVNTLLVRQWDTKKSTMTKLTKTGPSEVDPENVQPITKDQLKDSDTDELEAYMKHYEELCLASYGQTKSGVFKKNPLSTPKQVSFSADLEGLQDMMTKAMHQTIIDQSKVFTNTIQN